MKDFDTARHERVPVDRTFRIGGESFEFRPSVAPETIMQWTEFAASGDRENMLLQAAVDRLEATESMDPKPSTNDIARLKLAVADRAEAAAMTGHSEQEWVELIDKTALALITPECADRWHTVRGPDAEFPLSIADLQEMLQWLIGQVVGRPTEPPSGSSSPDETTTLSSTVVSSSPEGSESKDSATDVEVVPVA